MPVNNYLRECKYNLNNLDNYIYLYKFDEPILNYTTDDEESNATSTDIKGTSLRLYAESVQYQSTSSVDNRFAFDNTLTITLAEGKEVTHYKVIQTLLNDNWMVVFKNKEGEAFVMNGEYPVMISYSYVFNDEKTPNNLTITFRTLQNLPTINLKTSVAFSSTLRDKPCEYSISRIESLKMIDMSKAAVDVEGDGFSVIENGEGNLKTVEFNPTSLSFTDSYDGREFTQTLSFSIPFVAYRFYFHYNLLEYLDNRYYALLKTTNGNNILGGFRQGLFPSYTISTSENDNIINLTLTARYTNYSVLGSDTMNITTNDGLYYKPVLGECVNNLYTWTLIEQYNSNGVATNGYYCLNGFEEVYSDYTILGTYDAFDTTYGFKLVDFNIDCSEGCIITNLPSSIQFETSGETKCYTLDAKCSVVWEWNAEALDVTFDEITKELCVTSKVDDGTFSIKATSTDGTIQYATVVIGTGGITGDTTTTINITAEGQKVSVILVKGFSNVKSVTSTLQYITNENNNGYTVTVPENTVEEPRTFTITLIYNDNSIETINIIQDRIYYVITSSEETECYGNDLYYVDKKYKKYSEDGQLIFVENIKGSQKESDSINCLDYDEKISGCTACFEGYIYTLYEYKKDGTTVATRYEKTSETCSNNGTTQYITNTEKSVCENDIAYYVDELYGVSCSDNTTNIKLYPIIEKTSTTVAVDSNACDVIDPNNPEGDVKYRWVDTNETYCLPSTSETNCTSSTTTNECDGYNLYKVTINYVDALCDGNWVISGTPTSVLIETNSTECGYVEPEEPSEPDTPTGETNCTSSTTTTYCDGYNLYEQTTYYIDANCDGNWVISGTPTSVLIETNSTECGYVEPEEPEGSNELVFTMNYNPTTIKLNETEYSFNSGTTNSKIVTTTLEELGIETLTSCSQTFTSSYQAYTIKELQKFPSTRNVTTMYRMFYNCKNLTSLDLSSFNTSNVQNMEGMFMDCSGLTSLDLTSWDTSNVTSMSYMFDRCSKLTSLDLSSFNTSNVTSMSYMFNRCSKLASLDLSNFNTSNVTTMSYMFAGCSGLTSVNLNNFISSSALTNMSVMFSGCTNLTTIDLSSLGVNNVFNLKNLFDNCSSLTEVNMSNFSINNYLNGYYYYNGYKVSLSSTSLDIFNGCTSLTKLILGTVTQKQYDWWYSRLTEAYIDEQVTIEYTLI